MKSDVTSDPDVTEHSTICVTLLMSSTDAISQSNQLHLTSFDLSHFGTLESQISGKRDLTEQTLFVCLHS